MLSNAAICRVSTIDASSTISTSAAWISPGCSRCQATVRAGKPASAARPSTAIAAVEAPTTVAPAADAESHLQQAQTDRDTAVQHRTEVLAAFADLVSAAEAARRLALTPTAVRTAQRAAARHRPPGTAEDSVDRAGPAATAATG